MELTYDEAKAVISDKSNPNYTKYHNFDPDVHGAVTRAYLKQYPGEYDTSDSTPEVLRGAAPENAGDNQQAGADRLEVAGPEAAAKLAGYLGMTPGGPEFDAFNRDANEYIAQSFASYDDFYEMAVDVEARMGPEKAAKMLHDMVRGSKAR